MKTRPFRLRRISHENQIKASKLRSRDFQPRNVNSMSTIPRLNRRNLARHSNHIYERSLDSR
jgi:hypothetical protein